MKANPFAAAAMAGYLAAGGVPTDEAAERAEHRAMPGFECPVPQNPMYYGLPWIIPGPASGAPYYADRPGWAWGATWR